MRSPGNGSDRRRCRGGEFGRRLRELSHDQPDAITAALVALAANDGDPAATGILGQAAEALGTVLATVVALLDPEIVVVEGTIVSDSGGVFLDALERAIRARSVDSAMGFSPILCSSLGEYSAEVGAAATALDRFYYSPQFESAADAAPELARASMRRAAVIAS